MMSQTTADRIDLTQPTTYRGPITIKTVLPIEDGKKSGYLVIEESKTKVKYLTSHAANFATSLQKGATADAEIVCENDEYNGKAYLSVMLKSFGGPNKAATRPTPKGGGYPPRTKEETHAPSIGGVIKSALDYAAATQTPIARLREVTDIALQAYLYGLQLVVGGTPAQPVNVDAAQPVPVEPTASKPTDNEAKALARELGVWWKSIGGDPESFRKMQRSCELLGLPWSEALTSYREFKGVTSAIVLSDLDNKIQHTADYAKDDPANGMTGDEARTAYYAIAEKRRWPSFAQAGPCCSTVWKAWTDDGKVIADARYITDDQWRAIYRGAWRIENAGESEPEAFTRWKRQNPVPPNPPNGS